MLFVIFSLLLFGLIFIPFQQTYAQVQPPTATPIPAGGSTAVNPENELTLKKLGLTDAILRGPFDTYDVTFSTPAHWQLTDGAQIILTIDARFFRGESDVTGQIIQGSGATIDVTFNDKFLTTLLIDWTGERTVAIPIPPEALVTTSPDGRHDLFLFLDAAVDCFLDFHQTTIVIRADSKFILPHIETSPAADLSALPRPFFMAESFAPTPVKLVVSDNATEMELQSALTVAAGFGRLSTGRIPLTLTTNSRLTNDERLGNHLIFVGKAESFPELREANLPAASDGKTYTTAGLAADDGIVQIVNSPYNPARLFLVIGGNSDAGVVKAAQAVSSGKVRITSYPNLAIIADVLQSITSTSVAENRTIKDLGYTNRTLSGIGIHDTVYKFYVPVGQVAQAGSYIDLTFSHSALLDYQRSGLVIYINDQTIGGVRFTDQNAATSVSRIAVPAYVIRPGDNFLRIEADMAPSNLCSEFVFNGLWTTINDVTLLHLPLGAPKPESYAVTNLASYPSPFINSPTLETTLFVIPKNNPGAWNAALKLAIDLGARTSGNLVNLGVVYENPIGEIRNQHDLLIVGNATALPIISELNPNLPAPFEGNSNLATERGFSVVYRLPADASLGYLQWLQTPWDKNRTILAVLGSTDQGYEWASDVLIKGELRSQLGGDFAVIRGTQVLTSESRLGVGTGSISATLVPAEVVKTTPGAVQAPVTASGRPVWIIPVIIASTALIAIIILVAVFSRRSY